MKVSKKIKSIISVIVAVAMVITMLPQGQLVKAATEMDINIHFYDTDQKYAGKVYLQYWQEGTAKLSTKEEAFEAWNCNRFPLTSEESTEGADWYGVNIKGSVEGFQLLDETGKNYTGNFYNVAMKTYEGDLYYKDGVWYTENPVKKADAEKFKLVEKKDVFYLVGSIIEPSWDITNLNYPLEKNEDGTYSIVVKDVPTGKYEFKVLQDPENFAWEYAWGGSGSGGNYELTVSSASDVTITMNPADEKRQLTVKAEAKAPSEVTSPIYNEDGTMTFYYETASSGTAIGVRGNLKSTSKKSVLATERVDLSNGKYLYVATSGAIKNAGIYEYNFYELTKDKELGKKLGDPASTTVYGGSGAFVRNPYVEKSGMVSIFCPYDGEGAKVYYKAADSSNNKQLKAGDKVTDKTAEEYGYKVVNMTVDKDFVGDGMYSAKFFDKDGTYSYVIVNKDGVVVEDKYNFTGSNTFVEKDVDEVALSVDSPVMGEDGAVTFMYYDGTTKDGNTISVAGNFNDWTKDKDMMTMDEEGKGIWSVTLKGFTPGVYQYKFVINGGTWIADPLAKLTAPNDGNSEMVVPGLVPEEALQVEKGKSITLPKKVLKYAENVEASTTVEATYELKADAGSGVTLKDGVLTVPEDYKEDSVEIIISDGKTKTVYPIETVGKMYTYTIHYYAQDASTYANRDMWIWEADGKAYNTGYTFNKENYKDEKGREWATATYSFPTNAIKLIVRSKGSWDYKEAEREITLDASKTSGEFWIVQGETEVSDQWVSDIKEKERRYVIVEYNRPEKDYDGWNLYTWNATSDYNQISNFFTEKNGKYTTMFEIDELTSSVGYLLRSGTPQKDDWSDVTKDLDGDRSISTPVDQKVVKVKLTQGSLDAEYVPYNKGYELDPNNKAINFYYRDDDLFLNGELDTLKKVQVEVNGVANDMTYNKETERYEYTLHNAASGAYEYNYHATPASGAAVTVLDKFNDRTNADKTKSVFTYKDLETTVTITSSAVSAGTTVATVNYDENMVIGVTVGNKEVKATEAYADLSAIGGDSKVAIDTELMELTIGVTKDTTAGTKEIPVTVIDQYNKKHTGSISIKVVNRTKTDANDFDWDEAVIYFMVTDRFCDGNASNNDAYGVGDYNPNGPSSYHGGDFAGVTSKLDYLNDLGVNTIWITPVVENILTDMKATGDNGEEVASYGYTGYWASNFEKLNKHLGTVDEFHTLIDEAHARGIRIMVDVVLNHSGYGTEKTDTFANMYREQNVDGNDILGSLDGLPDFATEKAEVRNKLIDWQTSWIDEIGVTKSGNSIDYFRVDTVKHVDSTTWSAFKNAIAKISPKFKMIGEAYGAAYTDDFGYLHSGMMDSLLDFGMNDMANKFIQGELESVESQLETRNGMIDNAGTFGNFLNSHDENGLKYTLMSLKNEDGTATYTEAQADAMVKVAASLSITAKGQPVIYYGEEIGLSGANNYPYQENRYDMKFNNLSTSEQAMLTHYKKMLAIRNDYSKIFAKGTRKQIAGSNKDQYIAFERSYQGQNAVVALNVTEQDKEVTIKVKDFAGKTVEDVYNQKTYQVADNGKVTITIPSSANGGTAVLVAASEKPVSTVTADKFTAAKKAGTSVVANTEDSTGNVNATWTFAKRDVKQASTDSLKTVKLACTVSDATSVSTVKTMLKKDKNNSKGAVLSFAQTGTLPVNATVKVSLANQTSIANGSKVYVYHVTDDKFQQIPVETAKVTEDGYVSVTIAQGGTYVLLPKKASASVRKDLIKMVSVKLAASKIKTGKTTKATVSVPTAVMKKVTSFSESLMSKVQTGQVGAKVTYRSSNSKVATINSSGKITGKKKGTATISITVRLSDGQKMVVKKKVTVK